nr:HK97 family phage prohead protease [Bacillus licheniformis]
MLDYALTLQLPNTQYANDLYENIRLGNISNCSFGFLLGKGGDSFTRDQETGLPLRSLRNISKLTDVSVVTYPAYEDTDVTIAKRNLQQYEERNRNPEKEKAGTSAAGFIKNRIVKALENRVLILFEKEQSYVT